MGIGARNLRECLLMQIDYLAQAGTEQPYAREIVSQFLTELAEHKFNGIARELKISAQAVSAAWQFVKQELNPRPADGFSPSWTTDRNTRAMYITPDVVITRRPDDQFEVEVIESRRFELRIDPTYTRLAAGLRAGSASLNQNELKMSSSTSGARSCSSLASISAVGRFCGSRHASLIGNERFWSTECGHCGHSLVQV